MQTFDKKWEEVHQNKIWGKYPAEELVRFICRKYSNISDRKKIKILDLGCGGGANTWFLCNEGFDVYAIDGSTTAIDKTKSFIENMKFNAKFHVADASSLPFPDNYFDCVIDIACIYANTTEGIKKILKEVNRVLKPHACLFSSYLINDKTTGYKTGEQLEANTFRNMSDGLFANIGIAHFFNKTEITQFFSSSKFMVKSIDELTRTDQNSSITVSYYIVTANKL